MHSTAEQLNSLNKKSSWTNDEIKTALSLLIDAAEMEKTTIDTGLIRHYENVQKWCSMPVSEFYGLIKTNGLYYAKEGKTSVSDMCGATSRGGTHCVMIRGKSQIYPSSEYVFPQMENVLKWKLREKDNYIFGLMQRSKEEEERILSLI